MIVDLLQGTDPEDVIKNAFGCFDEDNVGLVHEDRLRELLTTIGDRFTDDEVGLMMATLGRDLGCSSTLAPPHSPPVHSPHQHTTSHHHYSSLTCYEHETGTSIEKLQEEFVNKTSKRSKQHINFVLSNCIAFLIVN